MGLLLCQPDHQSLGRPDVEQGLKGEGFFYQSDVLIGVEEMAQTVAFRTRVTRGAP